MSEGRTFPDLLGDCVHCGFCLQACPTYQLWGEEMDSPRGRIRLMAGLTEGDALDPARIEHFDTCLGCMGCMTACPSGVQYDKLIEQTRARVEETTRRGPTDRVLRGLIFSLFPYPRRIRLVLPLLRLAQRTGAHGWLTRSAMLRRAFPRLTAMAALAPQVPPAAGRRRAGSATTDVSPRQGKVALLTGCVQDAFFASVNRDTVTLLAANGIEVVVPAGQGCCGSLSLHNGRDREAVGMARRLVDQIPDDVDAIITNAAGCGSTLKSYGELLADDPRRAARARGFAAKVKDITEYLGQRDAVAPLHPVPLRVAYHDACHLAHAQGVRREPRDLIGAIPGVELVEIAEPDLCCGSAGVYNILQPTASAELGARKARHVSAARPDLLVAGNPGCLMQLAGATAATGSPVATAHTVELLAAATDAGRAGALAARCTAARPADAPQ
ncbi:(Fe-S)-binding protein [Luedemannella helvata]|uniref:Glycolate oxidase iron-sulfur subunit n=1 Tax=Luedemannella helvata TaxID=349315 RepID=A0ABP4VWL5_9ACTN